MGIHYGQLISVVSAYEQIFSFENLLQSNQQGDGIQRLSSVVAVAKVSGAKAIWCNARKDKTAFYRNLGFEEKPIN